MLKLLLTLVVIVLGLMFWFGKGRARPSTGGRTRTAPTDAPQAMVACAHCGLHLPRAEVFLNDRGEPFCGAEHRRLGPARVRR